MAIDSKDSFLAAVKALDNDMTRLQAVANNLVLSHPDFVGRFTKFWERWNAFRAVAVADADKFFSDWDKHADTLDLYQRERDVYKSAAAKKIQEQQAAPLPEAPPGRTPGTAPRARPRRRAAPPATPLPDIPLAPVPPSPRSPRAVTQNIGPIVAGVAALGLVAFLLTKKRR